MKFTRKCTECGKDLYYATLKGKKSADKLNKICKRCSNTGNKNPNFGKKCPDHVKDYLKKLFTGRFVSESTKEKHRQHALLNNPMTGLTGSLCPNFGKTRTDDHKQKLSLLKTGIAISQKHRESISKGLCGRFHTDETKQKMRLTKIKHIIEKNGSVAPRFNLNACKYFDVLEKEKCWDGLYATKNGEFFIKSLGYFVDYYEPKLNIVVEYDEPKHYNIDNSLKEKDVKRMNEIKFKLNCKFYRYNERLKEFKEY